MEALFCHKFIKQKLNEVISQGSSGSVVKDVDVRYGGP